LAQEDETNFMPLFDFFEPSLIGCHSNQSLKC